MASTGLNFTNITPDNGAVRELSQIMFEEIVSPTRLGSIFNIVNAVHNGDKLAFVGEFGLVGKADSGCSPDWNTDTIATTEKTWDVADWLIAETICFKDLVATLVKYTMTAGTNKDDLTSNEYLAEIVKPRLETAIRKMLFRVAWFGDKAADTTANGGILKVGTSPAYFTLTDGIWKQLYAIATATAARRVTVAANAEATYAAQKAAIAVSGVATGILDSLIMEASPKLRGANNQVIYVTLKLKDALDADIRKNNKGSELQWKAVFDGITEASYNGVKLVALPLFDEIIDAYEGDGTAWNKPYRAVYTTEDNLLLGIGGTNEFADIRVDFDPVSRKNYIAAADRVGALVGQNDLIQVAY